ncbi:hypothetical protein F441_20702, partial [Phytophthora nicotianae CJ01A1]
MVRLRKLNQSAKLPFKTKLCLGTPSRHQMENRAEFTPPASENKKLKVLLETLGRIQSESRQLQSDDVMLWEVRFCIERPRINSTYYGDYLDTRGTIVASPDYESACVRIQLEKAASSESPREEG